MFGWLVFNGPRFKNISEQFLCWNVCWDLLEQTVVRLNFCDFFFCNNPCNSLQADCWLFHQDLCYLIEIIFFFSSTSVHLNLKTHTQNLWTKEPLQQTKTTEISNQTKKKKPTGMPCTHSLQMIRSSVGPELNQKRRDCQVSGLMFLGHTCTETWLGVMWTVKSSCLSYCFPFEVLVFHQWQV